MSTIAVITGGGGAWAAWLVEPLKTYAPLSWVVSGLLCAFIAVWMLVGIKFFFKKKRNLNRALNITNIKTYAKLRLIDGDLKIEDSSNVFINQITINSQNADSAVSINDKSKSKMWFLSCVFHECILPNYISVKDAEGNNFPYTTGNYNHILANIVIYDLEENKSLKIEFN